MECKLSRNPECGIDLEKTGDVFLHRCKIEGSEIGVYVKGNKKRTCGVDIIECCITLCGKGVILLVGDIAAHIISTCFQDWTHNALIIYPGVVGTVELVQCNFVGGETAVANSGGPKCAFSINGNLVKSQVTKYDPPDCSLSLRRNFQHAGLLDILCLNCGNIEDRDGEKFSMCGLCKDVVYCSKDCQRAHWKEHKKTCKRTFPRPKGAVEEKKSGEEKDSGEEKTMTMRAPL